MSDIHEQLRALLDRDGAAYRVIEHEPEGRTEVIARIRDNRLDQAIKSIVVQVRLNSRENLYCLANVPATAGSTSMESRTISTPGALRSPRATKRRN